MSMRGSDFGSAKWKAELGWAYVKRSIKKPFDIVRKQSEIQNRPQAGEDQAFPLPAGEDQAFPLPEGKERAQPELHKLRQEYHFEQIRTHLDKHQEILKRIDQRIKLMPIRLEEKHKKSLESIRSFTERINFTLANSTDNDLIESMNVIGRELQKAKQQFDGNPNLQYVRINAQGQLEDIIKKRTFPKEEILKLHQDFESLSPTYQKCMQVKTEQLPTLKEHRLNVRRQLKGLADQKEFLKVEAKDYKQKLYSKFGSKESNIRAKHVLQELDQIDKMKTQLKKLINEAQKQEYALIDEIFNAHHYVKNVYFRLGVMTHPCFLPDQMRTTTPKPDRPVFQGDTQSACGPTSTRMLLANKLKKFREDSEENRNTVLAAFRTVKKNGGTPGAELPQVLKKLGYPIKYEYIPVTLNEFRNVLKLRDEDGESVSIVVPIRGSLGLEYNHEIVLDSIKNINDMEQDVAVRDPLRGNTYDVSLDDIWEVRDIKLTVPIDRKSPVRCKR